MQLHQDICCSEVLLVHDLLKEVKVLEAKHITYASKVPSVLNLESGMRKRILVFTLQRKPIGSCEGVMPYL